MILDYAYNKVKRVLSVSYIKDNGLKDIMNFNVDRFKTYYSTPNGKFINWDGDKCDIKWTDKPDKFDIKTYIEELPIEHKIKLQGKTSPKLYTWDIEVVSPTDEFPKPEEAKFPIVTISVCSPDCNVIILGTKSIGNNGQEYLNNNFGDYISKLDYFKKTGLSKPTIKYIKFETERDMLLYFLKNIVAKVPVLAGWNSMLFDWQYVQNRIKGYYPDINLNNASCNWTTEYKNYTDMMGNKIRLSIPNHTVMLDMMDVIESFDYVVMPVKESLSLDYIAYESLGVNKIEYDGTLTDLYYYDYQKYVFYNAIDSVLVQLIDKRFKTLQNIYTQALYCREKIGLTFSKIAVSEALVFNYFYDNNIKVIPERKHDVERGTLVGAYVRTPTPGKHNYVCCNDFASLYPSTIITCNLSFENFVGEFYNEAELAPYRSDRKQYIVVGGNVHKNDGTQDKPKLGDIIKRCLDEETLNKYRSNPKYFVSVNGHVYINDKNYAFKNIQATLKANRNTFKYLAKQLYAIVMTDVEHVLADVEVKPQQYPDNIATALKNMGYDITGTMDIVNMGKDITVLKEFALKLATEIEFYTSYEQAMKLLGNSMYGGSSHISFFWFNMSLANDITGEARNIIKIMESHIPEYIKNEWPTMTNVHKELGITVDSKKANELLKNSGKYSYVDVIYGDTDSMYISYNQLVETISGYEKMTPAEKGRIVVEFNTKYLDAHNREVMAEHYKSRHVESVQNFELETLALSGVWLDVKKRYAQVLLWKDGKTYSIEEGLPMKAKGLELIKASYPKQTREGLQRLTRYLLEDDGDSKYLLHRLNAKMQEEKQLYFAADIDDICASMKVNGYKQYMICDHDPNALIVKAKCPANVRAAGNYNRIRQLYKLPGEPINGGKVKYYIYIPNGAVKKKKQDNYDYFAYQAKHYPKWADQYAPVARGAMFQKFTLDPFNRIIEAIGLGTLNLDGSIQMGLSLF
jgi:DNA polymerase elongation subunit (family B)